MYILHAPCSISLRPRPQVQLASGALDRRTRTTHVTLATMRTSTTVIPQLIAQLQVRAHPRPPRTSPTFSRREHDVQPTISTLRFFYSCDVRQGRSGWTNAPTHGLAKQLADARADGRRASARKHSLMPSKNPLAADRADGRGAAMGDLISRNLHSLWA